MTRFVVLKDMGVYGSEERATELVVFENEIDEDALLKEYSKFDDLNLYPDGWEWNDLIDLLNKFGKHKAYSLEALPSLRY